MEKASGLRDPTIRNKFQTYGAKGGAAVVIDATDGSVVALSSKPDFDVTRFTDGIPVEEFTSLTNEKSNNPLLDRAISGQYAPGSTFKLFSAIAALEVGSHRRPTRRSTTEGEVKFGSDRERADLQERRRGAPRRREAPERDHGVERRVLLHMGFRFWDAFDKDNRKSRLRASSTSRSGSDSARRPGSASRTSSRAGSRTRSSRPT